MKTCANTPASVSDVALGGQITVLVIRDFLPIQEKNNSQICFRVAGDSWANDISKLIKLITFLRFSCQDPSGWKKNVVSSESPYF